MQSTVSARKGAHVLGFLLFLRGPCNATPFAGRHQSPLTPPARAISRRWLDMLPLRSPLKTFFLTSTSDRRRAHLSRLAGGRVIERARTVMLSCLIMEWRSRLARPGAIPRAYRSAGIIFLYIVSFHFGWRFCVRAPFRWRPTNSDEFVSANRLVVHSFTCNRVKFLGLDLLKS